MSQLTDKKSSLTSQFTKAFITCAIAEAILQVPAVKNFACGNLELTEMDLIMIPIGTFLFFMFWKFMEQSVFTPFIKLHEAREAATTGSIQAAEKNLKEAEEIRERHQNQLAEARQSAVKEKLNQLETAKNETTAVLTKAETEATNIKEKSSQELDATIQNLKSALDAKVEQLAEDVASKVKVKPQIVQ